ncbi:hypothetical protein DAI22_04g058350 [Oryza sativa Japonica Group]|nr:hypothetical protein DAI22_04g058350 [Oryza sativa Japonica Group]
MLFNKLHMYLNVQKFSSSLKFQVYAMLMNHQIWAFPSKQLLLDEIDSGEN